MADQDTQTLTETPAKPTTADTAQTAIDAINQLKAHATAALDQELRAIADAANRESVDLRLKKKNSLDDLVGAAAWLARDLVDTFDCSQADIISLECEDLWLPDARFRSELSW